MMKMKITDVDLWDHYDFYVDNCTANEIPLSFKEWKREYQTNVKELLTPPQPPRRNQCN